MKYKTECGQDSCWFSNFEQAEKYAQKFLMMHPLSTVKVLKLVAEVKVNHPLKTITRREDDE